MRLDDNLGVCSAQFLRGGGSFGQALLGVTFIEEYLPLQVAELDKIAINDAEAANSCANDERSEN